MRQEQLTLIDLMENLRAALAASEVSGREAMQRRIAEDLIVLKRRELGRTAITGKLALFLRDFSQLMFVHNAHFSREQRTCYRALKDYYDRVERGQRIVMSFL